MPKKLSAQEISNAVLQHISTSKAPQTAQEIFGALTFSMSDVEEALTMLLSEVKIEKAPEFKVNRVNGVGSFRPMINPNDNVTLGGYEVTAYIRASTSSK